jgi:hypothetical protein
LALDDFEDRFASAVKLALDGSRISGGDELGPSAEAQCPSLDIIASYYEYALSRVEHAHLETHFSHCARCQGTLAALLHAAPIVEDTASEAGGFAAAAARRAAAKSAGIRERWFEISPVWRIAGTAAAAAAMLAVVVVAGLHLYPGRRAPESEQATAARVAPPHHRHKAHTSSSTEELALNENKSLAPAATAEPHSGTPPAAAAAVGTPMRDVSGASPAASAAAVPPRPTAGEAAAGLSNAPAEAALPSQTAAPLPAPANTAENADETAATAAQAAAALGALASTPVPAASPASAAATAGAAATADAAATPSMEAPGTSAGAPALASKNVGAAVAAAPLAGAVVGGSVDAPSSAAAATATAPPASGAAAQAKPAVPRASEAAARAAATATPGTVTQELAVLAPPPPRLEPFQKETVTRQPATSEIAPNGNSRKSESTGEPAASADATELSSKAQKRAQLAEKKQAADIAREAKRALHDARLESAAGSRRPDSPAAFQPESAVGGLVPGSAAALPVKRPVAPQPQRALSAAGAAHSAVGHARAAAPSAVPSGAGNAIAMTDRPVASAPAVAKIAPGIPVPPRSILISPADHSVYWSLQNFGLIYRTVDHKTWTPQPTGVQADLLAGMATSNTVCWAVGRKGTILLTTDGMHWEQIKSPTASDVVGITAAGKDVATIFTSGGVNYSTFDGGSNWEKAN